MVANAPIAKDPLQNSGFRGVLTHAGRTPSSLWRPVATCYVKTVRGAKDGKPRFQVKYRVGGRYTPLEHAGSFRTKRDAEKRRDLVSGWLAAGKDPRVELARARSDGRSVTEAVADWLEGKRVAVTAETIRNYQRALEHVTREVGSVRVDELAPDDVRRVVGVLADRLAPATVKITVGLLGAVLDAAGVEPNPARHRSVERPRAVRATVRPPDAADTLAMLRAASDMYVRLFVVLEQTGMRVSEALAVRAEDVDAAGCRILLRAEVTKTRQPRWVPLPDWLEVPWPLHGSRQSAAMAMKRACEVAGVRHVHPHALRHRRASLWHLQGVPAVQAAAWLGHSPEMHLRTYAHVMPVDEIPVEHLAALL